MIGTLGAVWGVLGVGLLLGSAVYRLTPVALEVLSYNLLWYHWTALAANVLLMAYSEGYRGFQQGFAPRVAARARYLRDHPDALHALLGPFFCMGYFHATCRRRAVSLGLTGGIVVLVLAVRMLPQPWRGIVDAGVVVGLVWGVIALLGFSMRAFSSAVFSYAPEVPRA